MTKTADTVNNPLGVGYQSPYAVTGVLDQSAPRPSIAARKTSSWATRAFRINPRRSPTDASNPPHR